MCEGCGPNQEDFSARKCSQAIRRRLSFLRSSLELAILRPEVALFESNAQCESRIDVGLRQAEGCIIWPCSRKALLTQTFRYLELKMPPYGRACSPFRLKCSTPSRRQLSARSSHMSLFPTYSGICWVSGFLSRDGIYRKAHSCCLWDMASKTEIDRARAR